MISLLTYEVPKIWHVPMATSIEPPIPIFDPVIRPSAVLVDTKSFWSLCNKPSGLDILPDKITYSKENDSKQYRYY